MRSPDADFEEANRATKNAFSGAQNRAQQLVSPPTQLEGSTDKGHDPKGTSGGSGLSGAPTSAKAASDSAVAPQGLASAIKTGAKKLLDQFGGTGKGGGKSETSGTDAKGKTGASTAKTGDVSAATEGPNAKLITNHDKQIATTKSGHTATTKTAKDVHKNVDNPDDTAPFKNFVKSDKLVNASKITFFGKGKVWLGPVSKLIPSDPDHPDWNPGVVSKKYKHEAKATSWSPDLYVEGKFVVRTGDTTTQNKKNTTGVVQGKESKGEAGKSATAAKAKLGLSKVVPQGSETFKRAVAKDLATIASTESGQKLLARIGAAGKTIHVLDPTDTSTPAVARKYEEYGPTTNATTQEAYVKSDVLVVGERPAGQPPYRGNFTGSGEWEPIILKGKGSGSDSKVVYDPINGLPNAPGTPPDDVLFHELAHAANNSEGKSLAGVTLDDAFEKEWHDLEEKNATEVENQYRAERNLPIRPNYTSPLP
jgi:hypothetical protein